jgi:HSP90 family molecular chaperone
VCGYCAGSERHSGHALRTLQDVATAFKQTLGDGISEVRLKKNKLAENKAMLGTKLTELNIKVRRFRERIASRKL